MYQFTSPLYTMTAATSVMWMALEYSCHPHQRCCSCHVLKPTNPMENQEKFMPVPLVHVAALKSLNKREHIQEPSLIPCLPCHPASQMLQLSCPQTHKSHGKPREIYACSPGTWGSLEVIEQRMGMMHSAPWKYSFWDDNLWNFLCATFRSRIWKGILMFHTCNLTPKQMGWERACKEARYFTYTQTETEVGIARNYRSPYAAVNM